MNYRSKLGGFYFVFLHKYVDIVFNFDIILTNRNNKLRKIL